MPDLITATEYLEINSVPLATPAWRILDLTVLNRSAEQRGSDRLKPLAGVQSLPRRPGLTTYPLPFRVWGHRDREGTYYDDVREGLKANLAVLHAAVFAPVETGDGTRAAIWHQAGGTTVSKNVKVLPFEPAAVSPRSVRGVLTITITTGRFA